MVELSIVNGRMRIESIDSDHEELMAIPYKILFVDDEPDIRALITEFLQEEGFDCRDAQDGFVATEMLTKEKFDLLITDFRMPRMNGSQLLEWCRDHMMHFPVIFVTGNSELLPSELNSLKDCCSSILNKPVNFDVLLEEIQKARKRNHQWMCHRPEVKEIRLGEGLSQSL